MKLLDTSVAIDHLRGSPEAVGLLSGLIEADEILLALDDRPLQPEQTCPYPLLAHVVAAPSVSDSSNKPET